MPRRTFKAGFLAAVIISHKLKMNEDKCGCLVQQSSTITQRTVVGVGAPSLSCLRHCGFHRVGCFASQGARRLSRFIVARETARGIGAWFRVIAIGASEARLAFGSQFALVVGVLGKT